VDVAKAIGDDLGVETCFATPAWDAITAGNWADKWDVSVGSMTVTEDREQILDFSVPYYYTPAVVAVRADSGITDLAGLSGQTLCAGTATTYETWLNHGDLGSTVDVVAQAPDNVTVIPLETDQECAQAIAAGRQDFIGYVTSETVVDANIAADIPVVKLGGPVYYEKLAAAFDKKSTLPTDSLRAEVDKLFDAMHGDGRLSQLSTKWYGADYTNATQ
jgi:polar amino acid transport system substrate-binding protein